MVKKLFGLNALVAILVVGPLFTARAIVVPDLTPYQPPGWSDKIVVTRTSGSTNDSANLLTTDSLFVDWSVINSGGSANAPFQVALYLDGVANTSWTIPSLGANSYTYVIGQPIGSLSAGSHTVEIIADSTHVYTGTPNTYTKMISVSAVQLAAPTLIAPANAATGQPEVPFFNWNSVASATSYRIIIATSAADLPSSPTATTGGPSVIIDAVSPTTNFSPTIQLSQNTTYHWEVHAISSGGEDGTWSTIQAFTTGTRPAGLTIVPSFDSSITSDPNAATIEATINAAISVYRWNFSDAVTVNATFVEEGSGLGDNSTYFTSVPYLSSYRAALVSHASTADDTNALAHLPSTAGNPVTGDSDMDVTLPLLRALGFNDNPPGGDPDGTVYLNTSIMNLSSFSTDPTKFSLFATVSHELDEVLGFGSALNGLNNGDAAPTGPAQPEDLFRYDSLGNRSLTTSISATSFFSLDGTTDLAQFNQHAGGDFGDWFSFSGGQIPEVQDAYATQGANPVLNVELRVLDVIGYHRVIPAAVIPAAAPVLTNALVASGNFVVTIIGTAGSNYVLQATSRLSPTNWASLSTNAIPGGGSVTVTNPVGTNVTRFYRAHSQ